ncbi:hypothetical protein HJG60_008930 [Phyllostomus discolor]|uniref:Uncharacterized protein n=1 Tax=Phyllostomus discolor TaxID=89673 RepID=A0A833YUE1_9CHIR|nr:hypothetical protein HJG60_008930 [Phyllostomus discolor]
MEAPGGLSRGGWAVPGGSRFSVIVGPVCRLLSRTHWLFKPEALVFRWMWKSSPWGLQPPLSEGPSSARSGEPGVSSGPLVPSRQLREGEARDPLNVSCCLGRSSTRHGPAGGRGGRFSGNALAPCGSVGSWLLGRDPCSGRGFEKNGSAVGRRPGHHARCATTQGVLSGAGDSAAPEGNKSPEQSSLKNLISEPTDVL